MWKVLVASAVMSVAAQSQSSDDCFKYNETTHQCVNKKGEQGLNGEGKNKAQDTKKVTAHLKTLFSKYDKEKRSFPSGDLECWNLKNVNVSEIMDKTIRYSSAKWDNWNWKGANLQNAILPWAHIWADFRGADLASMKWGYVTLNGKVDSHTKLPEECVKPHPENAEVWEIDCQS